MRISTPVRILLLLLAVASPALLRAQFQQPTAEELAMTADPKAPGAAAVYLNIEEITDDPHHFYSFYTRIKILQETGKNLANVEIPFQVGDTGATGVKPRVMGQDWLTDADSGEKGAKPSGKQPNPQEIFKIDDIKGRTIHSDGTVVSLTVRPDELLKLKSPDGQFDRRAFTMPGGQHPGVSLHHPIRRKALLLALLAGSAPLLRPQVALRLHALQRFSE